VVTDHHELLAFGAKIARPDGRPQAQQVLVSEPIEGFAPLVMAPARLGGLRHISAAKRDLELPRRPPGVVETGQGEARQPSPDGTSKLTT